MESKSVINSGIKIPMVECSRAEHEGQPLTSICLQFCLEQSHQGHRTESIRARIKKIRQSKAVVEKDTERSRLGDSISSVQDQIKQAFQVARQKFLRDLAEIEELAKKEFTAIDQQIAIMSDIQNIECLVSEVKSSNELQAVVDKIKSINSFSETSNPIGKITEELSKKKHTIEKLVEDMIKKSQARVLDIKNIVSTLHQFNKPGVSIKLCDKGHNLIKCSALPVVYIGGRYICNICSFKGTVSASAPIWHCNPCNYDMCTNCGNKN